MKFLVRAAYTYAIVFGVDDLKNAPAYRFGPDGQDVIAMVCGEAKNPGPTFQEQFDFLFRRALFASLINVGTVPLELTDDAAAQLGNHLFSFAFGMAAMFGVLQSVTGRE